MNIVTVGNTGTTRQLAGAALPAVCSGFIRLSARVPCQDWSGAVQQSHEKVLAASSCQWRGLLNAATEIAMAELNCCHPPQSDSPDKPREPAATANHAYGVFALRTPSRLSTQGNNRFQVSATGNVDEPHQCICSGLEY